MSKGKVNNICGMDGFQLQTAIVRDKDVIPTLTRDDLAERYTKELGFTVTKWNVIHYCKVLFGTDDNGKPNVWPKRSRTFDPAKQASGTHQKRLTDMRLDLNALSRDIERLEFVVASLCQRLGENHAEIVRQFNASRRPEED